MAVTNLAVFGGAFFTPILVGKITHTIGWKWSFYFEAIFIACCLPVVFFFVPETAFNRAAHLNTDLTASDDAPASERSGSLTKTEAGYMVNEETHPRGSNGSQKIETESNDVGAPIPAKRSYLQSLKPFNGRVSDEAFWKLLFRPFPLFFQPAIFWACIIQGCMIGWTVFIGVILAAIFLGPPLFWDEVNTGYAYTGAFIGAIAGFAIAGILADWSAKWMTRRNNGIYEPEFRLLLIIPQFILGVVGLFGFGKTGAELINYSWVLPVFFFGCVTAAMVCGAVGASLYIVDAHRKFTLY